MSNVTLRVNGDIAGIIEAKLQRALEEVGLAAEGYAKLNCPVDTGRLRGSISHAVNGNQAVIGTNVEYAAYVEFGTGSGAAGGNGTNKTSWVYRDKLGHFHRGFPQPPRPFIQTAISEHVDEYAQIVAANLNT